MPTLRALECFIAVADRGSITAAARALHLSQPALSHQLASLEREIGAPVLERLPRGVRLTPAGKAVLPSARAATAAADRALHVGRAMADGVGGALSVICAESMVVPVLAPIVRRWTTKHPEIRIDLTESTSAASMVEAVESGTADVAIGPFTGRGAHDVHIADEEVVVVLPPDDRSNGHPIEWAFLDGKPVVHYDRSNGLGVWLDTVAAEHHSQFRVVTRTRHAATAANLAHAGLGYALVPTTALTASFTGRVRSLRPRLHRPITAIVGSTGDTTTARFVADIGGRGLSVPAAIASQLGD